MRHVLFLPVYEGKWGDFKVQTKDGVEQKYNYFSQKKKYTIMLLVYFTPVI